jgi:hypothetical protein
MVPKVVWITSGSLLAGAAVALSFPAASLIGLECGGDPAAICAMGIAVVAIGLLIPGTAFGLLAALGFGMASAERSALHGLGVAVAVGVAGHLLIRAFVWIT